MWNRATWKALLDRPWVEIMLFVVGVLLIIASPIAGVIPGPGGIFVFAAGLALVLKTSMWAKRNYVRFKRWKPTLGDWSDWGLRRASARRRAELRKARQTEQGESIGN
jgi:hypothetical protein